MLLSSFLLHHSDLRPTHSFGCCHRCAWCLSITRYRHRRTADQVRPLLTNNAYHTMARNKPRNKPPQQRISQRRRCAITNKDTDRLVAHGDLCSCRLQYGHVQQACPSGTGRCHTTQEHGGCAGWPAPYHDQAREGQTSQCYQERPRQSQRPCQSHRSEGRQAQHQH